jgi:hypothetical protein
LKVARRTPIFGAESAILATAFEHEICVMQFRRASAKRSRERRAPGFDDLGAFVVEGL